MYLYIGELIASRSDMFIPKNLSSFRSMLLSTHKQICKFGVNLFVPPGCFFSYQWAFPYVGFRKVSNLLVSANDPNGLICVEVDNGGLCASGLICLSVVN